jgi:hypothetical protein
LYCSAAGLCAKDCTSTQGCSAPYQCNNTGRCVPGGSAGASGNDDDDDESAGQSGGSAGSGAISGGGKGGYSANEDSGVPNNDMNCQTANVFAQRVIPTVVLVIDQSGSMKDDFGGKSRWNALRDFLLKPDGLIATFEKQVRFGVSMYSAVTNPDASGTQTCPMVTSVGPVIMNYAGISAAYKAAEPIGETPTGDAIDKIVDGLPKVELDKNNEPVVLLLATDGEPDRCEELNPQHGQAEAIAAVERAYSMGFRTFILSVGNEVSATHQQDVANAGIGHKAGDPNAPYWKAGDDASLRQALTDIIGAQISCDVTLKGSLQNGNECDGTVELNGKKLDCNGNDGWKLKDPNHISLMGKACSDFKTLSNALVSARFPCSVDILF